MNPITSLLDTNLAAAPIQPFAQRLEVLQPSAEVTETLNPFGALFNAALDTFNSANSMALYHEHQQIAFATGRLDDILAVQMSMDRASNAITFTSQITNRVIEAYREIMRMQI